MRFWKSSTRMISGTEIDHRCRRDAAVGDLVLRRAREERDRRRHRPRPRRRGQRDRQQELVPGADEGQDPGGGQAGRRERHDDLAERLEVRRPVDQRRLLEVLRDLPEERDEDVDGEREREGQVRDDQPDPGVEDPDVRPQLEQRRRDRDLREGRDRQHDGEDHELARAASAAPARRRRTTRRRARAPSCVSATTALLRSALVKSGFLKIVLVVVERRVRRDTGSTTAGRCPSSARC